MNCPECGRFMALIVRDPPDPFQEKSAYVWWCSNPRCWQTDHPIDAPEYDWLMWGITNQELEELRREGDTETVREFEEMRQAYLNRPERLRRQAQTRKRTPRRPRHKRREVRRCPGCGSYMVPRHESCCLMCRRSNHA